MSPALPPGTPPADAIPQLTDQEVEWHLAQRLEEQWGQGDTDEELAWRFEQRHLGAVNGLCQVDIWPRRVETQFQRIRKREEMTIVEKKKKDSTMVDGYEVFVGDVVKKPEDLETKSEDADGAIVPYRRKRRRRVRESNCGAIVTLSSP